MTSGKDFRTRCLLLTLVGGRREASKCVLTHMEERESDAFSPNWQPLMVPGN